MSILFGPILQFRGFTNRSWQISALFAILKTEDLPPLAVSGALQHLQTKHLASIPFNNPRYELHRIDFSLSDQERLGQFSLDNKLYTFHTPGISLNPRIAYVSCNGFSDPKLIKSVKAKNERWIDLHAKHQLNPYHILIMGGDQIYTDEMWKRISALDKWTNLPFEKRIHSAFTQEMQKRLDELFCQIYIERWNQSEVLQTLSSIPTIMMWDDHDIMDGWGSYPKELHNSPVYQGIFSLAKRYFQVFQMQLADAEQHARFIPAQTAFNMGFGIGDIGLLVLDLRTERKPEPSQIISPPSWEAIYQWLDRQTTFKHLYLISSIPVSYVDLGLLERTLGILPGQQELEDDLRDHWRSEPHLEERKRLLHRLLNYAQDKKVRITIISGDVHVGALSIIESSRESNTENSNIITQLIASGVVHPAPPAIARYVLETLADKVETIDRGITGSLQRMGPRGNYLIGSRNWLSLEPDDTHRIWAKWYVEGESSPLTKVIHPV